MGNQVDGEGKAVKSDLITPNAYGTILDLGASQTASDHIFICNSHYNHGITRARTYSQLSRSREGV